MIRYLGWMVACVMVCLAFNAQAGKSDSRLSNIEKELREVRNANYENSKQVADAIVTFNGLQEQFLALKGSLEENQHYLGEHQDKANKFFQEMDSRLTVLEEQLLMIAKQLNQILSEIAKVGDPGMRLYYETLAALNRRQYKEAVDVSGRYLAKYPKHSHAAKVQYWRAEAYFAMKDYKSAIPELQKVIKNFPESQQIPAVLLKQGISFFELGAYNDSKLFFQKLVSTYPDSDEAFEAKKWLVRIDKVTSPGAGKKNLESSELDL